MIAADSRVACSPLVVASAPGISRFISLPMIAGIIWKVEALPPPVRKNSAMNIAKKPRKRLRRGIIEHRQPSGSSGRMSRK